LPVMSTDPVPPAEDMYAIFCGDINAANAQKLVNGLTSVSSMGIKRLHLLFQSWGGFVGDGVFLYNLFKNFPVDITLYNAGQVSSAGVLAFLGARQRKATANAAFMIHRSSNSPSAAGADRLKVLAETMLLEDARVDVILRSCLTLPEELWTKLEYHDVTLSGQDGVKYGFADEIAEFSPPVGVKVLNALG